MMFSTGPSPDPKLIEDRPDDVSVEAAVGAWLAGYSDARKDREYHVFPPDSTDLQPFYSNGFERGERDELHMQRINGRLPEENAGEAADREEVAIPPAPIDRLLATIGATLRRAWKGRGACLKAATDVGRLVVFALLVVLLVRINLGA